jgi:predicted dehydrogenase
MSSAPIKTAILSYGMSGEIFHAPLLHAHRGFHLSTIVQRHSDHAGQRYPDVKIARQAEEVFHDPEVELIVVNTPNDTHHAYTTAALLAGKHVVVEKPFTVTTKEADELIALSKKQNRLLSVFQNRRWDGDFLTVLKVLEQKLLGKVVEFEAHYDRYRNYIEAKSWKEEERPGNGILYNLGSHMLDQVLVLFGVPEWVDARMGIQRPGGKVNDFYDIRLTYQDFHAIVKSSYLVREQGPRYIIHGVEGSFVKYGIDPQEQSLKEKKTPGTAGWGEEGREHWGKLHADIEGVLFEGKIGTVPGNYLHFYQNIYDAIREGKPLMVKPESSRDVIKLIEISMASNEQRRAIPFV